MVPSRSRWRVLVALGAFASSVLLWWTWSLTPLQRWYFWPYLNCSLQGDNPALYSEIHWLYKSAPRRTQELATDEDVVWSARKQGDSLPVELSAVARKEGWTQLIRGEEAWIEITRLRPFVRKEFYGDQSLWKMLLTPLLWSIAVLLCLLAVEDSMRTVRSRADRYWTIRGEASPALLTRRTQPMEFLRFTSTKIAKVLGHIRIPGTVLESRRATNTQLPSQSTQTGVSFFGSGPGIPGERPVWSPPERDRLM